MHTNDKRLTLLGFRPSGDFNGLTCYTSKRKKLVWFIKAPPTKPPTEHQRYQRLRFTLAATAWRQLTEAQRHAWERATRRAHLNIHGYDLWIWWNLTGDARTLRTVERISGIHLAT